MAGLHKTYAAVEDWPAFSRTGRGSCFTWDQVYISQRYDGLAFL